MLTDEQLRAVGCLAVESTHLELYIEGIINAICKFDQTASDVFIGRLSIEPKAKIMRDLLWEHLKNLPSLKESFKLIYDDIKDMISKRNTAIHGNWGSDQPQTLNALANFKRLTNSVAKRRGVANTIAAKDIMALAEKFAQRQMNLVDWYIEYRKAIRTFPERASEQPPAENQSKNPY